MKKLLQSKNISYKISIILFNIKLIKYRKIF